MSEIISRSDWLYQEPATLSDADIEVSPETEDRPDQVDPEVRAIKVRQGGRMYYEAAKESEQVQELLAGYFNRTRYLSDLGQEVNEVIEQKYPERFATIKEADHYGLGFAAKALAEDGILEVDVYETSPPEKHLKSKLIDGVPHWECNFCHTVIRSISDDNVGHGRDPTVCPVCSQAL